MKFKSQIRRLKEFLSSWFSYFPVLYRAYDFDYTSILEVERHQISRVRDCIAKYHSHLNWERDVRNMNLALQLLDIIEEDGEAELLPEGTEHIGFLENGRLEFNPESYYKLNRYVNTRNAKRFIRDLAYYNFEDPRNGDRNKDQLRVEKAWKLYHKLRPYKTREWWD